MRVSLNRRWGTWWLVLLALSVATPSGAETLTNDSIVTLIQAGVGETAVIAKINATAASFMLGTADIVDLKRRGVPDAVITTMIAVGGRTVERPEPSIPTASRLSLPAGLYMAAEGSSSPAAMVRLVPTMASQTRSSGILTFTLTGGLASMKMKAVVPGRNAPVRSPSASPEFYLYVNDDASGPTGDGGLTSAGMDRLSLVRFEVKSDRREAGVGTFNIAGTKTGVESKDRIAVDRQLVTPGVYRLRPQTRLASGEYGFLTTTPATSGVGLSSARGITSRVFDFTVAPAR